MIAPIWKKLSNSGRQSLSLLLFSILFCLFNLLSNLSHAQTKRIAVVANGLNPFESISVVNLDHPDLKKAVQQDLIKLGQTPNDIQIDGQLAYVVNTNDNHIQIIDLKSEANVGQISTGANSLPEKIALLSDQYAYVTLNGSDGVAFIDLKAQTVLQTIKVGSKPWGVTILDRKVYVTNSAAVWDGNQMSYDQSSVSIIDTQSNQVIQTIEVPINATGITTNGIDKVLVVSTGDYAQALGYLTIINHVDNAIEKKISLKTTPGAIAVNRSQRKAYILSTTGWTITGAMVVDLAKRRVVIKANEALPAFSGGFGMVFDHQSQHFFVAVPDWSGGGQDQLRKMSSDGQEITSYAVGKGASFVAVADINGEHQISVRPTGLHLPYLWGEIRKAR
ncbi:MAG: YncE family protein [Candidatus Poribacteria bacterium]|nr:YncE family protein [Candidatus Poribacteria bacterium]